MNLSGNAILITGGTSGIGRELAKQFKEKGNKVIVIGKNQERLDEMKNLGIIAIKCDMSKIEDLERLAMTLEQTHNDVNILFNNAGIQYNYLFSENIVPIEKIRHEFEVNVIGHITLTHLILPILSGNRNSYIVNTTSGLGFYPKKDGIVYSSTKAAMHNFNIGLRDSLKGSGVKVLEFIPPVTDTNMTSARKESKVSSKELISYAMPLFEKDYKTVTTLSIKIFRWIAIFPGIARRLL